MSCTIEKRSWGWRWAKTLASDAMAVCILCAKRARADRSWFLLMENQIQDRLRALRWKMDLAAQTDVHEVCCAEHVLELVVHWMTTGSLDYPFARFGSEVRRSVRKANVNDVEANATLDTAATKDTLAELSIDRGSIQRILRENPEALYAILSALMDELEARKRPIESEPEDSGETQHLIVHRA